MLTLGKNKYNIWYLAVIYILGIGFYTDIELENFQPWSLQMLLSTNISKS